MVTASQHSDIAVAADSAFEGAGEQSDLVNGLLLSSRACVKLIDASGALQAMNTPGRALMEIDDFASVCGTSWADLWPEEARQRVAESVTDALKGVTTTFTAFCPTAKGSPRWWDVTVTPIRTRDGAITQVLSCSYDVTHIKEREHALQKLVEDRQQLVVSLAQQLDAETRRLSEARQRVSHSEKLRVVGQFVGSVVHDINNVLAVMQSASRILRRRLADKNDGVILEQVEGSVARGAALVRRLLDFSRNDGGTSNVFRPDDALRADAGLLKHLVGETVSLATDVAPDLWPVLADRQKFLSVVFNLVSNARDAVGDDGQVSILLRNCPAAQRPASLAPGDYVVISVVDNGSGMPPDVLARAGEPFFTTKGEGRGTGLGLASAFELAEQCGGRVLIDSSEGAGTRISIYLPRSSDTAPAVDASAKGQASVEHDRHGGATVLVVKSDLAGRQHVANLLRDLGYVVLEAASEAVALATALREVRIDLVITDLAGSPDAAARLADHLRQDDQNLPFIFIRAAEQATAVRGEMSLVRPVRSADLAEAVLIKLGRKPAVMLSTRTLETAQRALERAQTDAARDFGDAWHTLCKAKLRLPSPADFQQVLQRHSDNVYLVVRVGGDEVPESKFVMAGAAIVSAISHPVDSEFVSSRDERTLGFLARAYKRAAIGIPYRDTSRHPDETGSSFERLIVPLSADGRSVTHLAGIAMHYDGDGEGDGSPG